MTSPNKLETVSTLLKSWPVEITAIGSDQINAVVSEQDLHAAVTVLREWGYLSAITGIDLGIQVGKLEVLYHFCAGPTTLSLRVQIPRDAASLPSICDVIPYANLYERELSEMLGIIINGTPTLEKLFLPDDWPEGVYPLRKDAAVGETSA